MDNTNFFSSLKEIYAAHGKASVPPDVSRAIWQQVQNFPDSFLPFMAEKLLDYEKLPSNLGREVRCEIWPVFLEKFPQYKAAAQGRCHQCSADVAGWFWAQGPDGTRKMFKCACNRQREFEHISGYTHAAVERQGYAIITDQVFYMRQVLAGMPNANPAKAVQIKPAMRSLQRVDREQVYRMRHLPDTEQQAYANAVNV